MRNVTRALNIERSQQGTRQAWVSSTTFFEKQQTKALNCLRRCMDAFPFMNVDILDFVPAQLKSRNLCHMYCPQKSFMEIQELLATCVYSINVLPLWLVGLSVSRLCCDVSPPPSNLVDIANKYRNGSPTQIWLHFCSVSRLCISSFLKIHPLWLYHLSENDAYICFDSSDVSKTPITSL